MNILRLIGLWPPFGGRRQAAEQEPIVLRIALSSGVSVFTRVDSGAAAQVTLWRGVAHHGRIDTGAVLGTSLNSGKTQVVVLSGEKR